MAFPGSRLVECFRMCLNYEWRGLRVLSSKVAEKGPDSESQVSGEEKERLVRVTAGKSDGRKNVYAGEGRYFVYRKEPKLVTREREEKGASQVDAGGYINEGHVTILWLQGSAS